MGFYKNVFFNHKIMSVIVKICYISLVSLCISVLSFICAGFGKIDVNFGVFTYKIMSK